MPLIPEHILDEIQSRADIAECIARYVPLKRAGRHFKALCPFHQERTPSFHINTDKQIFHCFGCGAGGNIFSFLMQQERLTFPEAVQQLADQVGVAIQTQPALPQSAKQEQVLGVLEKACRYYERLLAHPRHGAIARNYLESRGVTAQARNAFRLGCAAGSDAQLVQAAAQSKLSAELLDHAGLALTGARGTIDRFRNRLIFPIVDIRGRVLGFGGRSLADQTPKYLNSPETSVYTKGRHLFGLSQAKDAVVKTKLAIVVEGYFDCVLLWQAGFRHTVSPLGTAFTPEQARLLARYAERAVLAFDADAAGEMAALRGIDILVEAGLHVQVVQLPSGIDPDEYVRAEGAEAFQRLLDQALNVVEFLMLCASKRYDLRSTEQKVEAAQFVLTMIAKIPDAMLKAEYVRVLANRLRLDEAAVIKELSKARSRGLEAARPVQPTPVSPRGAERVLVALIVDQPDRWDGARGQVTLEDISDPALQRILRLIDEARVTGVERLTPAQMISRLATGQPSGASAAGGPAAASADSVEAATSRLVSELVQLAQSIPAKDKAFDESIRRLHADARHRHLAALRQQIHTAQELGHQEELERLLTGYQQLVKSLVPAGTEG